ncbi:MAG: hypothetical protein AAF485_25965, partial [Chloroflexota bacterium]
RLLALAISGWSNTKRQYGITYHQALEILGQINHQSWLGIVYHDLAEAYAASNEIQVGQNYYRQALTHAKAINHRSLLVNLDQLAQQYPQLQFDLHLNERQKMAIDHVREHSTITNKQYRALTNVSQKQSVRDLNELVEWGILMIDGKGRATRYILLYLP